MEENNVTCIICLDEINDGVFNICPNRCKSTIHPECASQLIEFNKKEVFYVDEEEQQLYEKQYIKCPLCKEKITTKLLLVTNKENIENIKNKYFDIMVDKLRTRKNLKNDLTNLLKFVNKYNL